MNCSVWSNHTSKLDTPMRNDIPARVKLEVTLSFLASGNSYQSLALLNRLAANTISSFLPEVLQGIIFVLNNYMKVSDSLNIFNVNKLRLERKLVNLYIPI